MNEQRAGPTPDASALRLSDYAGRPAPVVSVIMPSFNSGAYIREAILSVLEQRGPEVEVIVQDGGSTDRTRDEVMALGDPRVTFTVESDKGQSDALNKALARAAGEWILWLNADDFLAADAIASVQDELAGDADVIFGAYAITDASGTPVKTYMPARLERRRLQRYGTYVFSGALLVRRSRLIAVGGFDPGLVYCMDLDLLMRLADGSQACRTDVLLANFRLQPESKTSTRIWSMYWESVVVTRRYGGHRPRELFPSLIGHAIQALYILTRPVWQSRTWRRLKPSKRRGGWGAAPASRIEP